MILDHTSIGTKFVPYPISSIALWDCRTNDLAWAEVVPLTRIDAADRIRRDWWMEDLGVPRIRLIAEDDHGWDWVRFAKKYGSGRSQDQELIAIRTPDDGKIQGACLYRIDGRSFLEPGEGCIFLERVAVAPRNRAKLLADFDQTPAYRGVGTALIQIAIAHSAVLGMGGRVNGYPIPNAVQFYEKKKFQRVDGQIVDGDVLYEVSSSQAIETLREAKLLDAGETP